MKISYCPTGINNFHNRNAINLIIKNYNEIDGEMLEITKYQAWRIGAHFCGVTDCRCPAGAIVEFDPGKYAIMKKWIE